MNCILRRTLTRCGFRELNKFRKMCHLFSTTTNQSKDRSLSEIREQLGRFSGGEVTLSYAGTEDSIAIVSISNTERKNAFTGSMCVSLYDKVLELSTERHRKAVIVCGLGGMFCSGADLSMAKQISDPVNGERFSYFMQTTLSSLRNLRIPTYAAVQGNVLGGGAELLVACDFALATAETKIYFIQGRMGIVPGWAGATHLVSKVGYHKALDILLTGKGVNSDYAKSIGLIDGLIEPLEKAEKSSKSTTLTDEQLLARSVDIIEQQIGHLPAEVICGLKSVAVNAVRLGYSQSISHERQVFKSLWGAEANVKALSQNLKHA